MLRRAASLDTFPSATSVLPEALPSSVDLLLQVGDELLQGFALLLRRLLLLGQRIHLIVVLQREVIGVQVLQLCRQDVDFFLALAVLLVGAVDGFVELVELTEDGLQLRAQGRRRLLQHLVLLLQVRGVHRRLRTLGLVLLQPIPRRLHLLGADRVLLRQLPLLLLVGLGEFLKLAAQLLVFFDEVLTHLGLCIHLLLHILHGSLELAVELRLSLTLVLHDLLALDGDVALQLLQLPARILELGLHGLRRMCLLPAALLLLLDLLQAALRRGLVLLEVAQVLDPLRQGLVQHPDLLVL
mmetsp:Transcript_95146/g.248207  ORF Transcript_95146/g.248207 Transcript_95146/m.248207 type:complete len:298 (+) Transcript_95146:80-973(+)